MIKTFFVTFCQVSVIFVSAWIMLFVGMLLTPSEEISRGWAEWLTRLIINWRMTLSAILALALVLTFVRRFSGEEWK